MARLALPILLQNLCTTLLGLIDTFMVGALGKPPGRRSGGQHPRLCHPTGHFRTPERLLRPHQPVLGQGDTKSINRVIGLGCYVAGAISWPLPPSCSSCRSS
ncbi:hypothetical protein M5E87_00920 [Flavonifractor plautii]|nr:hypothetical protein M5E87_00920 [Flavonifractor plautii]